MSCSRLPATHTGLDLLRSALGKIARASAVFADRQAALIADRVVDRVGESDCPVPEAVVASAAASAHRTRR